MWALLFLPLRRAEVFMVIGVCLFFFGMNASALKQGIFQFREPDILGMPFYELFMWGFYLLHVYRFWGDAAASSKNQTILAWVLGIFFAAAFSAITDQRLLFAVTAGLLVIALVFFHDQSDLAYAGHMVVLGALIEYVGVHAGQWSYPIDVPGGVPPWFVTMWGGIGLFFRRLVLPWMSPRMPGLRPAP
ncbi:MAG: hypothetical protein EOO78_28270 [Oxalobacteraceae bacterium]|nr:MAG: hypothetical protein EOO78_28270 [Oxalobacteraceae bacterium]